MIVYPLDITIANGRIKLYCLDESFTHCVYYMEFINYFYATSRIEHADIQHITPEQKLFYGTVYKHETQKYTHLKDIYENAQVLHHDISITTKFAIAQKLRFFTQTHITLSDTDPTLITKLVPTEHLIDFTKLNILGFDIETYAPTNQINSLKNPVLSIATYTQFESKVFTYKHTTIPHAHIAKTEAEMITDFCAYIQKTKPHIIVGYNSDAFDFAYLKDRAENLGITLALGIDAPLRFSSGQTQLAFVPGIAHIDLLSYIRMHLRTQLQTTSYSLNNVAGELLGEQKHDVDITQLYKAWDTADTDALDTYFAYNIQDAKLCVDLFRKLQENIFEFGRMIYAPIQDITRMSYSQLVEHYLMCHVDAYNTLIPPKPTQDEVQYRLSQPKNIGAYVFEPTPGFYTNIVVFDYRSLYPSIIASLNIDRGILTHKGKDEHKVPEFPGALYFDPNAESFIPHVTKQIVLRRDELKTEIANATPAQKGLLKARIYNLKILANSLYGYLSFARARWYNAECGGATTAYARHYIKQTIERATQAGFSVIYSDTDSIFLELKTKTIAQAKAFVHEFNTELPGIMELQFEASFDTGLFVGAKGKESGAKKRYALYNAHADKFKIAGLEYVRTDWSPLAREIQYDVLGLLLKAQNKAQALQYVKDKIAQCHAQELPFEKYILNSRLSRDLEQYNSNLPHVVIAKERIARGETVRGRQSISYVVAKGKGAIYQKARIPEDVTLADLDMDYYIENQIIPAVSSILATVGYSLTDITSNHTQNDLGQFF